MQVADGAATRVGVRERGATARAESHGAGAARVAKQALLRRRAAYFEEQVKGTGEGNVHAAESYVLFSSFSLLPPYFSLPPPSRKAHASVEASVRFVDVRGEEEGVGSSYRNVREADRVQAEVERLKVYRNRKC